MGSKILFLIGGMVFATEVVWQLYKRLYNPRNGRIPLTIAKKPEQNISEVMFFSRESSFCRAHVNNNEACLKSTCPVQYLRRMEGYINRAEKRLDVCMYVLTCQLLSKAIVNAHKRGVIVNIILDRRMACTDSSQTALFHGNGIAVRMQELDVLMHHKFVIVDNEIVITGSVNWTMSAFFGNFENILVTNQPSIVLPFVEEFDKLWKLLEYPIESESEGNRRRLPFNPTKGIMWNM
ncbi:PREDICTED: mitochondrial cardiolipin hydrolase [Dufourea novaeangliae]|uniref:Mitochondrial cardiolipin hydrolase n=1 Tax=Dufourea novaeangliae TaxID=178035 RepID=A0A154PJ03_DUFNO|nr:PREDICTED: mitochondrial cardiolipin hydrolase [Dufourea novaeangliae]KZC11861.1 Mitochondrial cardiolipin hydrolase [Dufourea novaeangliae]